MTDPALAETANTTDPSKPDPSGVPGARRMILAALGGLAAGAAWAASATAGPLDPPFGSILPTSKPLSKVAPRIAINATGGRNRIDNNHTTTCDFGVRVLGPLNVIVRTVAGTNVTSYAFVAGNTYGPVINDAGNLAGSHPVSGSVAATRMGSTDPWANVAMEYLARPRVPRRRLRFGFNCEPRPGSHRRDHHRVSRSH